MKQLVCLVLSSVISMSGVLEIPEAPFQYRYEILANSRDSADLVALYKYKEQLIETYEAQFMNLPYETLDYTLKHHINAFAFLDNARPYYISGTIVVLIGDAKGLMIQGELRQSDCDTTVIREKIFIFDLFS